MCQQRDCRIIFSTGYDEPFPQMSFQPETIYATLHIMLADCNIFTFNAFAILWIQRIYETHSALMHLHNTIYISKSKGKKLHHKKFHLWEKNDVYFKLTVTQHAFYFFSDLCKDFILCFSMIITIIQCSNGYFIISYNGEIENKVAEEFVKYSRVSVRLEIFLNIYKIGLRHTNVIFDLTLYEKN